MSPFPRRARWNAGGASAISIEPFRLLAVLTLVLSLAGLPLSAQDDYRTGFRYYQERNYAKAVAVFEPLVAKEPSYEFGHRILGACYLGLKQYDKAIASFREALRQKPSFVSYTGLAQAYFNLGRYQEAIQTLDAAETLAKMPEERNQIYRVRGAAAFNAGDMNRAVADLEKARQGQRPPLEDRLQLGIAYFQLGRIEQARAALESVVAIRSNHPQAQRYLSRLDFRQAVTAIEKGQYEAAKDLLRPFVERNPDDAEAWFNLGLAYLFGENLPAAEGAFERSLRLAPDNGDAHNRLGYIYEKTGQYRKSLGSYQKAFQLTRLPEIKESVERVQKRIAQSG